MSEHGPKTVRPGYGIDAPGVVRNLLLASAAGVSVWGVAALGGWTLQMSFAIGAIRVELPLARMAGWTALGCGSMAFWMLWSSKFGKVRQRERLLDRIDWTGAERVLDVGCGRGLMLIGAAKRLTTGTASGIDLWQAEDLSGNRPEGTLENARQEAVADRVDVQTADMREIPFPDATFDVVVSSAAIHNLYEAKDRGKAIGEIARVLKPGGRALIDDIRHGGQYAAAFAEHGCDNVQRLHSPLASALVALITFGSLLPTTLLARKSQAPPG